MNFKSVIVLLIIISVLNTASSSAQIAQEEYDVYTTVLLYLKGKGIEERQKSSQLAVPRTKNDSLWLWATEMSTRSMYGGAETYGTVNSQSIKEQLDSGTIKYLRNKLGDSLESDLIDDFNNKNKRESTIDSMNFGLPLDIQIVPEKEFNKLFKGHVGNGWNKFYEKYPKSDGMIRLSRVGFNRDRSIAFVLHERQIGPLGGSGYYFLLRKQGSEWSVVANVMAWIS